MPRDLFGDVVARPPSVRSRRTPLVLFSITAHVVVLLLLVVTTLIAADALPSPREAAEFFEASRITDIQPPPPPPPARLPDAPRVPPQNPDAAPLFSPDVIAPEPPMRDLPTANDFGLGIVDGVSGVPGGLGTLEPTPPAPPPPPRPTEAVRLHSGITAPQKVINVAPIYPSLAQQTHVQGVVIIEATIDVNGNVVEAKVLRAAPLLEEAALTAVRQWKFTPALLNGVPIPVIMTVTVNFKLDH